MPRASRLRPDNLIWQTALSVAQAHRMTMPPIELHIQNEIPLGKGMGSSAAALTAGVVIADELLELGWKPLRILDEAARLEGHPDNVAPCTLGSIVASAIDSGGVTRAVRLPLPKSFDLAIVVPDFDLPTSKARAVLPSGYSREDAVFNVQRAALLIAALATGTTSVFPAAIEDRFHQPYREALVPGLHEILRLRAPGLLGCALSGAGPSHPGLLRTRLRKRLRTGGPDLPPARPRSGDPPLQHPRARLRTDARVKKESRWATDEHGLTRIKPKNAYPCSSVFIGGP